MHPFDPEQDEEAARWEWLAWAIGMCGIISLYLQILKYLGKTP